ncbi:MAG: DUF3047 domain-containing protein [Rubrivivax sp.]
MAFTFVRRMVMVDGDDEDAALRQDCNTTLRHSRARGKRHDGVERWRDAGLAVATLAWALPFTSVASPGLAPLDDAKAWVSAALPSQKLPQTRFETTQIDGSVALRISARGSYGNLVHTFSSPSVTMGMLRWRWRLDTAIDGADLRTKLGDDAALKVCALFDMPLDRVPFVERQLLRMARSVSGQELPAATVCYVWAPLSTSGAVIPNAHSRRMRWIVLQGQGSPLGTWQEESRSLQADFLRAFGDETGTVPPLIGVLVGADADNTGGSSSGLVQGLRWTP